MNNIYIDSLILLYAFIVWNWKNRWNINLFLALCAIVSIVCSIIVVKVIPTPDMEFYIKISKQVGCFNQSTALWSIPEPVSRLVICNVKVFVTNFSVYFIRLSIPMVLLLKAKNFNFSAGYWCLTALTLTPIVGSVNVSFLRANIALAVILVGFTVSSKCIGITDLQSTGSSTSIKATRINKKLFPRRIILMFTFFLAMLVHLGSGVSSISSYIIMRSNKYFLNKVKYKFNSILSFSSLNLCSDRFIKFRYPFCSSSTSVDFIDKQIQFCMINANKLQPYMRSSPCSLWKYRHLAIQFFEKIILSPDSNLFSLYGADWHLGLHPPTLINHFFRKTSLFSLCQSHPIFYRGKCDSKSAIINNSSFVFCYENFSMPNYFTEKLPDVINSGAIPLYIGDPIMHRINTSKPFFIDPTKFSSLRAMITYCLSMTLSERALLHRKFLNNLNDLQPLFSPQKQSESIILAVNRSLKFS